VGRIRAALLLIAPAKLFIAKASPWQGQHTAQPWWFWLCNYLSTFLFFIGMFNRTISVSILGCFFFLYLSGVSEKFPFGTEHFRGNHILGTKWRTAKIRGTNVIISKMFNLNIWCHWNPKYRARALLKFVHNYIWNFYHCIVCCRFSPAEKALEGMTSIQSMLMVIRLWMWLAAFFTKYKNSYDLELSREIKL